MGKAADAVKRKKLRKMKMRRKTLLFIRPINFIILL